MSELAMVEGGRKGTNMLTAQRTIILLTHLHTYSPSLPPSTPPSPSFSQAPSPPPGVSLRDWGPGSRKPSSSSPRSMS